MNRLLPVIFTFVVFLLIIAPGNSEAFWPHYADESLLISPSSWKPGMSPDGEGGAIIAWQDGQVFAQRISATGELLWGETGIRLCSDNSSQSFCDIYEDGTGGALAVWKDTRHSPSQSIYAQRIDQDGSLLWGDSGALVVTMEGSISRLRVVTDGAGGLIVTWNDFYCDDWGCYYRVRAQRLNSLGERVWTPQGIMVAGSCVNACDQLIPDTEGGAFILFTLQTGGSTAGIFVRRLLGSGGFAWDLWDGLIVSDYQVRGVLADDGQGGCLVGYYRQDYYSYNQVLSVNRLGPDGVSLWGYATGITSTKEALNGPVLSPTEDHGVLVGWSENISGQQHAFAQRISPTGEKLWNSSGVAVCSSSSYQRIQAIQHHGLGGAIVFWDDNRSAGSGLYAQGIAPTGDVQWSTTGVPVYLDPSMSFDLVSISDHDGGAILALRDIDYDDVHFQRLNRRGTLGALEPVTVEVSDVPDDEGGWVQVRWYASAGDVVPVSDIDRYGLWRYREGMEDWELTGEIPANGQDYYEAMIPTLADSSAGSVNWHDFRVSATTSDELETFFSETISGYSIDNQNPSAVGDEVALFSAVEAIAPNPFNPRTVITYQVNENQRVSLSIYDARGRLVRRLVEEPREAGRHRIAWDGCDDSSSPLPSGVYCCRLRSGGKVSMKKMTLIR